jgi:predicted DNA-binding transcriptional regulator YafY
VFGTLAPHTHRQKLADLAHPAPPLTCSGALVFAIEPLPGFEALTTALSERCAITIVYEHGWQWPRPQTMTPLLVLEVKDVAYVVALCHPNRCEKVFRLDRIRE